MSPAELKSIRQALGLSAEGFARLVGVESGRTVRRWEAEGDAQSRDIPGPVIVLAEALRDSADVRRYFGVLQPPGIDQASATPIVADSASSRSRPRRSSLSPKQQTRSK